MAVKVQRHWNRPGAVRLAFQTQFGRSYKASIENFVKSREGKQLRGKVQLILTSPPFPLASPKSYGNRTGEAYVSWLSDVCKSLRELLKPNGSLVLEIGNSWDKGSPTMSTLPLETLISIKNSVNLHVCQQFICNNPNRLPSPIVYVNKERNRVKDSYTHVWWFGRTPRPYADNRKILLDYSPAMRRLLERQKYNSGTRPSEHVIGSSSFLVDNGGSIPPNFLDVAPGHRFKNWLEFTGSSTDPKYSKYCAQNRIKPHPARMQAGLAEFFIRFLTQRGDLVLDPFAGSNTTGSIAEDLKRKWVATEMSPEYIRGSVGRFS